MPKQPEELLPRPRRLPGNPCFHLLKNLRDVVSRVFRQHADVLELVPTPAVHLQRLTNLRLDREASKKRTRREQTKNLFDSIHALSKKGMKNAQIARELGLHRHTVEKYLAFKTPPQRRHFTKKVSAITPYEDYILGRWEQGCRNATRIWREISEQGYPGAYQNVVRITRYLKEQERLGKPLPDRPPDLGSVATALFPASQDVVFVWCDSTYLLGEVT